MTEFAYVSEVRVERVRGPVRLAYLAAESKPIVGVHGAIADHYGVDTDVAEPHATTIDYLVAAVAG